MTEEKILSDTEKLTLLKAEVEKCIPNLRQYRVAQTIINLQDALEKIK